MRQWETARWTYRACRRTCRRSGGDGAGLKGRLLSLKRDDVEEGKGRGDGGGCRCQEEDEAKNAEERVNEGNIPPTRPRPKTRLTRASLNRDQISPNRAKPKANNLFFSKSYESAFQSTSSHTEHPPHFLHSNGARRVSVMLRTNQ